MALLCFLSKVYAQPNKITYPANGSIFQQNSAGSYNLNFGGCTRKVSSLPNIRYSIEKKNEANNNYTAVPGHTAVEIIPANHSITYNISNRMEFKFTNITLTKGYYRIILFSRRTRGNLPSKDFEADKIEFGVGDVYFIAGQSNAAGYNYPNPYFKFDIANRFIKSINNLSDATIPFANSLNWDIKSRVYNFGSKHEYVTTWPYDNNRNADLKNDCYDGLPYRRLGNPEASIADNENKDSYEPFKNGTDKLNKPVRVFPNGMASWCWAPLGYKLATNNDNASIKYTPNLFFNVAFPGAKIEAFGPGQSDGNKMDKTMELFGNIHGSKAVLWHQGEDNALDALLGGSVSDYDTKLNALIDRSRTVLGDASTKKMAWYVSNASLFTGNNVSNANFIKSTLSGNNRNISSQPLDRISHSYTYQTLINKQNAVINPLNKVYPGISSDDIINNSRDDDFRIHFSGNTTLEDVATRWYNAIKANYTIGGVEPTRMLPIEGVNKNGSNYTITVENLGSGAEYYWTKNNGGTMANKNNTVKTTSNSNLFVNPGPGEYLVCYVKYQSRFYACQPYLVFGTDKVLTTNTSTLDFNSGGGSLNATVIAYGITDWDVTSIPNWVTLNFNEQTSELNITVAASSSARSGIITLSENGGGLTTPININQTGSTVPTYTNLNTLTPNSNSGWYRLNASIDNNTMQVGGVQYFNGFGVHANNSMFFNLNGQYTTISGKVGRDDEGDNQWGSGNVVFYIKGDGVVKWTSAVQGNTSPAQDFTNVNVSGVTTLELYCDISTDNNYFDHGDWINPILTSGGGGGCTQAPAAPTNVYPSAYTVANTGQSINLNATCASGTVTWGNPVNATGSPQTVVVNGVTNYSVTCVNSGCPASNPVTFTVTVGPCSGLVSNNQVLGTWTATNHPLVVKSFHNTYWLTQRINSSPEQFLVRGIGMLTRGDVTVTGSTYANNWSCFGWNDPAYGYLATPNSSQFPTPAGYTLAYECPNPNNLVPPPPCNASNGTPYYTFTGGARKAVEDSTKEQVSFVSIIPNPNPGDFIVKVDLESESTLEIAIINSNGIVLESIPFEGKKGVNYVPYKTKSVGSGRYLLRVKAKDKVQSSVLVIE